MTAISDQLTEIGEQILNGLEGVNAARERALAETRQIVRLSANTIRAAHRNDFDEADRLLGEAQAMQEALTAELGSYPRIYWSGYVLDAQREYAEANLTLATIAGRSWPTPDTLGVEDTVYLNALAETAGELRRYALDSMRRGDLERSEQMLAVMDDIYGLLVTVDYPDAVTGGLRRKTDVARGVLERTRGDLTVALQQQALTQALERVESKLDSVQTPSDTSEG